MQERSGISTEEKKEKQEPEEEEEEERPPCLGRSSGEMLSMVSERDGRASDFSDII